MVRANAEGAAEYDKPLAAELVQPKALFQKNLGYAPDIIAYPYGRQDDVVVRRTKERGYVAASPCGARVASQGNDGATAIAETLE